MLTKRYSKCVFAILLVVAMSIMTTVTTAAKPAAITPAQEASIYGGINWCEFGAGVSVGLGLATFGGCVACGVGSIVLDVGLLVACT